MTGWLTARHIRCRRRLAVSSGDEPTIGNYANYGVHVRCSFSRWVGWTAVSEGEVRIGDTGELEVVVGESGLLSIGGD